MLATSRIRTVRLRPLARRVIPPLLIDALRAWRRRLLRQPAEWEFVGPTWPADSQAAARAWNDPSIVRRYEQVWHRYRAAAESTQPLCVTPELVPDHDLTRNLYDEHDILFHNTIMTFAYAIARAAHLKREVRVLDWGGALGHYALLARSLFPDVTFDYHCKEVPEIAEAGRRVSTAVTFHQEDDILDQTFDLIIASGSLQYAQHWDDLLGRFSRASQSYIFLNQVPIVVDHDSFVIVQRPYRYGYETEYISWCLRRSEMMRGFERLGLAVDREFVHGFKPPIAGSPSPVEYRGYLLKTQRGSSDRS